MGSFKPKNNYIPTTDDVETDFHEFASELEREYPGSYEEAPEFSDWREAMYGFRRWIAEETRKAREKAVDDFEEEVLAHIEKQGTSTEGWPKNPHRKED